MVRTFARVAVAALLLTACGLAPTTGPATQPAKDPTVYITSKGKAYHRSECASLAKSKIARTKSEAEAAGYSPCKRCKP